MTYPPQIGEIQCFNCKHFQPDRDNPDAAMGRCVAPARHGYFYPCESHRCADREDVTREVRT
jgi:hypothetical protein